jgi:hypothetical protein
LLGSPEPTQGLDEISFGFAQDEGSKCFLQSKRRSRTVTLIQCERIHKSTALTTRLPDSLRYDESKGTPQVIMGSKFGLLFSHPSDFKLHTFLDNLFPNPKDKPIDDHL